VGDEHHGPKNQVMGESRQPVDKRFQHRGRLSREAAQNLPESSFSIIGAISLHGNCIGKPRFGGIGTAISRALATRGSRWPCITNRGAMPQRPLGGPSR